MSYRGTHYIRQAFNREEQTAIIKSFKSCLDNNIFGDFDGLVCRGTSGLLIAPILAYTFNKKLLVVRKPNDGSHTEYLCDGHSDIQKFIIVDDFACSGKTIEEILKGIKKGAEDWEYSMFNPVYVGCYFWSDCHGYSLNKEKICCSNSSRFKKVAKGKIFAQRLCETYKMDEMKED